MTKKNDITLPTPEDERLLNDVLETMWKSEERNMVFHG